MYIQSLAIFFVALAGMLTPCHAEMTSEFKNDFQTLNGHIITVADEYLLDLDAAAGLNEGDIVTLMADGEKIIHPVSKEVIGTLDVPQGFLQVTRIKYGYSYVTPLTPGLSPQNGARIVRFENVPSRITAATPADQAITQQIKTNLSQFDWLDDESTDEALMTFVLEEGMLTVRAVNDLTLYKYDLRGADAVAIHKRTLPQQPTLAPNKQIAEEEGGILNQALHSLINPQTSSNQMQSGTALRGTWHSPRINGRPSGIAAADLNGDGLTEIAVALRDRLLIVRIENGNYRFEEEIDIPRGLQLLSIDAIDLDKNGLPELYLTASSWGNLRSFGVEYRDGRYRIFAENTDWYLRAVSLPDRGQVLLGQKRGSSTSFIGQPFQIKREQDKLNASGVIPLPANVNLYNFVAFTDRKNQPLFAHINNADQLVISTEDGLGIWQSQDNFGGSEIKIETDQNQENSDIEPTFIPPRLSLTDAGEIIVIQNYGQRFLTRSRFFNAHRLVAFRWNGDYLQESWQTPRQKGYLADFALADIDNDSTGKIALLVQFKRGNVIQNAKSSIVTYQQNQNLGHPTKPDPDNGTKQPL